MKKIIKDMIKSEGNIYRYIVNKNINHLSSFLGGCIYCSEIYGQLSQEDRLFRDDFSKWVCDYYDRGDLDSEWNDLILFMNFNSYAQALDVFLELYKKWYIEEFGEDAW